MDLFGAQAAFSVATFDTGINELQMGSIVRPPAGGMRSSLMRRPSQYMGTSAGPPPSAATARLSVVEVTQSHPTALPNEFLTLVRIFRSSIDAATTNASASEQDELKNIQVSCSDIIRYVTSFLITRFEEQREYERKKLLGWSDEVSKAPTLRGREKSGENKESAKSGPDVLGPFLLTSLYSVAECLLQLLKCDRIMIFVPDGAARLKSIVTVGAAVVTPPLILECSHGVCGVVHSSGVAVVIQDVDRAPPQMFSRPTDELGKRGYFVRNTICFPLMLPNDDVNAIGPCKIYGVVQAFNKVKNSIYPTGFTTEDEEALHYYSQFLASLLKWGKNVEFSSNTSQEEGARLQQLILKNRFTSANIRTTGGTSTQTRLEANLSHKRQQQTEDAIEKRDESNLLVSHPVMRQAFRVSSQLRTRIYRVQQATAHKKDSPPGKQMSIILTEAAEVVAAGGNVRELLLMLEQADSSWKSCREECLTLRERVSSLENELQRERRGRFELEQLCLSCGLTDSQAPTTNEIARPNPTFAQIAEKLQFAQRQHDTYQRHIFSSIAQHDAKLAVDLAEGAEDSSFPSAQKNITSPRSSPRKTQRVATAGSAHDTSVEQIEMLLKSLTRSKTKR